MTPNKGVPPWEWSKNEENAINTIINDNLLRYFIEDSMIEYVSLLFMVTKIHVFMEEYCSFDAIV
jgi:hypothetical protein